MHHKSPQALVSPIRALKNILCLLS